MSDKMPKFCELVQDKFRRGGPSAERLAQAIGVTRQTIHEHLNDYCWWKDEVARTCQLVGIKFRGLEELEDGGIVSVEGEKHAQYVIDRWIIQSQKTSAQDKSNSPTTLGTALERMGQAVDREAALSEALAAIVPTRPAFLATIAEGVVPGALQMPERPSGRRETLYSAHDRGFLILFVTPSKERVDVLRTVCRFEDVPDDTEYKKGFADYREGYIRHLCQSGRERSQAEQEADSKIHLIEYDEFAVSAWLYTMSLIGESNGFGKAPMRVIERGPAGDCELNLIPAHAGHERGIKNYLIAALERTYSTLATRPPFASDFIRRLQGRA